MRRMVVLAMCAIVLLLAGCSSEPDLSGKWMSVQKSEWDGSQVVQRLEVSIVDKGKGSYLFKPFLATDAKGLDVKEFDSKKQFAVVKDKDGNYSFFNGLANVPVIYLKESKKMIVAGKEYEKETSELITKIRPVLEEQDAAKAAKKKKTDEAFRSLVR